MQTKTIIRLIVGPFLGLGLLAPVPALAQNSTTSQSRSGTANHGKTQSDSTYSAISPQMRQMLPALMQQLQNNPGLLQQFGLGGLGGLGGLNGMTGAVVGQGQGNGTGSGNDDGGFGTGGMGIPMPAIPGVNVPNVTGAPNANGGAGTNAMTRAQLEAAQKGGLVVPPMPVPEQVTIYRGQYHPSDINQDGRIDGDEAASYAAWMFRRHDINGDNVLRMREFSAVEALPGSADANRNRLRTEARRLELLFPKFDSNHDQMVEKSEFMDQVAATFDEKRGAAKDVSPFVFQTVLPF
ncbi:EF-hand domain-containing protein [Thalassospira mesophila]|uniref:EF-hand domain-containing protein n=1 Tax=Thalassospira mesophila TaxID=1293891 RepID=UPI00117F27DD|nr:EF-hand domain-containing protein [Thalassospira mesophila]